MLMVERDFIRDVIKTQTWFELKEVKNKNTFFNRSAQAINSRTPYYLEP